jgi:hypothetical protein
MALTVAADPAYRGIALFVSQGVADQTSFEAYVRVVYAIFGAAAALIWRARLADRALRAWATEQKLTFALVLVGVVANDPLYALHVHWPTRISPLVELVAPPLFHGMAYALALLNPDLVLRKSAGRSVAGFETLVGILVFVSETIGNGYRLFWPELPRAAPAGAELCAERTRAFAGAVFAAWASVRVASVVRRVDLTERFRSYMYAIASSVVAAHALVVDVLARAFGWFEGSGVEFVTAFAVYNTFALMMLYFHWPYEPVSDMTYEAGGAKRPRKARAAREGSEQGIPGPPLFEAN